ncbi:MAG: transglycosylase SLT domain-containing protein [Bacteroidia bacterium]|nr:transglycosylase SLT domain-containing protein [Bacteroidia bacterium]
MKAFITLEKIFSSGFETPKPVIHIQPLNFSLNTRLLTTLLGILLLTNAGSFLIGKWRNVYSVEPPGLYLSEKASVYVTDFPSFEMKVKEIAAKLNVPPEWLMAVMYSESRFDASAENFRGSGAVGLIQFMPATAKDMGTSTQKIGQLNHVEQLDWVYEYMQMVRNKYGEYESLTDFYLAILYPKARRQEMCYTLYANPSKPYKQNSGLDIDKDGQVTVHDIDKRMKRIYPTAYIKRKPSETKL